VENKQRIHKKVSGWLKKGMVLLVLLTLTLQAGGPGNGRAIGLWTVGPNVVGAGSSGSPHPVAVLPISSNIQCDFIKFYE